MWNYTLKVPRFLWNSILLCYFAKWEGFIIPILFCKNYDTGVQTEYGDKFITMSTCEYLQKNGYCREKNIKKHYYKKIS